MDADKRQRYEKISAELTRLSGGNAEIPHQPPGGAGPVKTYRGGRHTVRGIFHYQL